MQIETMEINQIHRYLNRPDCQVLDIRDRAMYRRGHIPGAVWVSYDKLLMREYVPDEQKWIFVYCDKGQHSYEACRLLAERGYLAVDLLGGFPAYRGMIERGEKTDPEKE